MTEQVGISGESLLPEGVADDGDRLRISGAIFFCRERATPRRLRAKQRKVTRRYQFAGNAVGSARAGQREALAFRISGDLLEDLILISPILEVGVRRLAALDGFSMHGLVNEDQAARVFERQRAEQYRIDDAEDGGVGSDTQSQSNDGNRHEATPPHQHPNPVAQILKQHFHRQTSGLQFLVSGFWFLVAAS